jgi:hypothetical protein
MGVSGLYLLSLAILLANPTPAVAVSGGGGGEYPLATPPPILSSEIFPCSGCHASMGANIQRRELRFHAERRLRGHAEHERWCLDCHDPTDRDRLRLINGTLVEFEGSHRLCGQCHGSIYRDWKAGVHGRRTGYWDGPKKYYLCTSCHDPHSPRFKRITPEPSPLRPEETLRR